MISVDIEQEVYHWQWDASCIGHDPNIWHSGSSNTSEAWDKPKKICSDCPVKQTCLQEAMEAEYNLPLRHRFGVFGGLTAAERFAYEPEWFMKGEQHDKRMCYRY